VGHHIIGLGGLARSGKDTVAAHLVERYGFKRYAFADVLKTAALRLDPIVVAGLVDSLNVARIIGRETGDTTHQGRVAFRLSQVVDALGWERAKDIPEVRRTLQEYGMAVREIDQDFWVRAVIRPALDESRPVVITDVRFPNEVAAVRRHGGLFVRVTRPGIESDGHVSESLDVWPDRWLDNCGTLDDLGVEVDNVIGMML
jgi:hypothetical protein